ncbi:MAG: hypothetical protein GY715_07865 [Planctomycetes bacterium]|nr:hypothetical protein [Planctomycetota bacterium]
MNAAKVVILLVGSLGGSSVFAGLQDDMQASPLLADDAGAGDHFGRAVATAGSVCVIGAHANDDAGPASGSAYVFSFDGDKWTQSVKLTASDAAGGDEFGTAVAMDGEWILVGARKDDDVGANSGSAYLFRHGVDGWSEYGKVLAPDGENNDRFGSSVAISGDTLMVGAKGDDDHGSSSGAIHVFQRTDDAWLHVQKLTASDGSAGDFFGRAAAMTAGYAVFGAYGNDDGGNNAGAAYVFRLGETGWVEEAKFVAPDASNGTLFGWSVGISRGVAVIGSPQDGAGGPNSGAAYVYRRNGNAGWEFERKLTAPDQAQFDHFGHAVTIADSVIAVGAPFRDGNYPDQGAAYLFRYDGAAWYADAMLLAPQAYYWDQFGGATALHGETLIVGVSEDDSGANNAGSAVSFRFAEISSCPADIDGDGVVNGADLTALLAAWGTCESCPEDLNGDGDVDFADINLLMTHWGACP